MIPYISIGRAWVAGSLVLGGCWVLGAWLSDGRNDWDTSVMWSTLSRL